MKDHGPLKYFLGIEVAQNSQGIYLCQHKYALDILTVVGFLGTKPFQFPMELNHKLGKATGPLLTSPDAYRSLIGRMIYLTITRLDLAYYVHVLSQFLHQPRQDH